MSQKGKGSLSEVRAKIGAARENGGNTVPWRTVAKDFPGVPAATLCAIYKHNRDPHKAETRAALGLPELGLGRICPVHHRVCDVQHKPPSPDAPKRPRRQWKRIALTIAGLWAGGWLR